MSTVRAIHEHREGGELTLKLSIKPYSRKMKDDDHDPVSVTADIKAKIPKQPLAPVCLWTDDVGLLLEDNPNQLGLPGIQAVEDSVVGTGDPRVVEEEDSTSDEEQKASIG